VRFSDYVKDFINGCIYARKDYLTTDPVAVRAFLAGWFDAVAFMGNHRDETIKIVQPVMHVTPDIAALTYDQLMPAFSGDGRFPPSALKVMAQSFVDVGVLPAAPDMSQLYTEAYLPKSAGN
jgi:ABC-type nitrate/sulfonate/bicarbonate transport system substrate-binding protein